MRDNDGKGQYAAEQDNAAIDIFMESAAEGELRKGVDQGADDGTQGYITGGDHDNKEYCQGDADGDWLNTVKHSCGCCRAFPSAKSCVNWVHMPDHSCNTTENDDHRLHFPAAVERDRKSTRLNSSHVATSYAVFCFKKKV